MSFWPGAFILRGQINADYPNAYAVVYPQNHWPTDLSKADAIIVLLNHAGQAATDPHIKAAVERGAGFMAIHYGVEVNQGEQGKNFLDWMGGYFETFWSVNPFWTADVKNRQTSDGARREAVQDRRRMVLPHAFATA